MSAPELLTAVKNRLVAAYTWVEFRDVSIEVDGQPPPLASGFKSFYVAIHLTRWQPGDYNEDNPGLHEIIDFDCTVSRKIAPIPRNHFREAIFENIRGLYVVCRQVMLAVHGSTTIMAAANTLLSGTDEFIRPPYWRGTDAQPQLRNGEWLHAETEKEFNNVCMTAAVHFGGAERIQCDQRTVN
jgi:hypothetical protein